MLKPLDSLRFLAVILSSIYLVSCGIPVATALHDLSAIHHPSDWSARSPAMMLASPNAYLNDGDHLDRTESFDVDDHIAVEVAILDLLANTNPSDPGSALETTSWLLIELLFDQAPEARIRSMAILSHFVGQWVTHENARLTEDITGVSLEAALRALTASTSQASFRDGLIALRTAPFPDTVYAARSLVGLGRRAHAYKLSDSNRTLVFDVAVKVVMLSLEQVATDPQTEVALEAQKRLDLIRPFATAPR
ncbi:MAG: hypothetical protein HOM34_00885 [Planctomycetes bacterium]|nr:hypothetical protein [Planctomycetota bacterium]MBT4029665.1 hypothetical protein [Planctomycetota bacterium]MBT5119257.1 hypothetical protein [Planctomycetota bacterium]MBT7012878.1 hypothetical protein [Planctomycetota bacterium]